VSTTPGNPKNLLEFKNLPGNPGNLLEFKKLVALFYLCCGPMLYKMHIMFLFYIYANYIYRVNRISMISGVSISAQSNANMSWIFLEIPPGIS